jgi:hypothetical protein
VLQGTKSIFGCFCGWHNGSQPLPLFRTVHDGQACVTDSSIEISGECYVLASSDSGPIQLEKIVEAAQVSKVIKSNTLEHFMCNKAACKN